MKKYDLIVFDLDGTLLDTSSGILACTDYVVDQYGFPLIPDNIKRSFIGPPIQESLQRYYNLARDQAWEMAATWRNSYKDKFLLNAMPYDGIYEVLNFCRECGMKTGVATNKREDYTKKLLDHFQFTPLFDCIAGTDFEGKLKKADLIHICMKNTGVLDGERCLMVGDTESDKTAAEQAGVSFLGVTYGFGFSTKEDGWAFVQRCREIMDYLIFKNSIGFETGNGAIME